MTTEFYSTKFNKTVDIPNPKVCGYRMSNRATKKGWSSGVRTGKDNGIVPQKLSRFSTDWEADYKHKCEGNTNWLNKNQRISFTKIKQGRAFEIKRPAFRSNTVKELDKPVPNLKDNGRDGLGNRRIERNNFISTPIKGREVLNFEKLQAQDIATGGIKVQLGDKTIEKLFKIQVGDPTDKQWLEEKTRRLDAGESLEDILANPPFGRPQRKINKMVNFGAQGLSIDDQIETIKAAVEQGGADNSTFKAHIIASTAEILSNVENLKNISQTGFNNLKQAFNRMPIPKYYKEMGFKHRFFSLNQYKQQTGLINLFLLNNLPEGRTLDQPVLSIYLTKGKEMKKLISIIQLVNSLQSATREGIRQPGRYLDLKLRNIIPFNYAVNSVNNGVDDGQLNGQNPPEDPPNNGKWLLDVLPRWDLPEKDRETNPEKIPIQGK